MKTPERFTNAVTKLYNAFHNGELIAMDCKKCAVGNMCDNSSSWSYNGYNAPETGYSAKQLNDIEELFMFGSILGENHMPKWPTCDVDSRKENNVCFEALCAVVEYLCELDGIPNVMDYTCLFETEEEKPKYTLEEVLN